MRQCVQYRPHSVGDTLKDWREITHTSTHRMDGNDCTAGHYQFCSIQFSIHLGSVSNIPTFLFKESQKFLFAHAKMMDEDSVAINVVDRPETNNSSSKDNWSNSRVPTPLNHAVNEDAGAVDEIERASFETAVVDQDAKSRAAVVWYQDASNRRILVYWALMLLGLLLWVIPLYGKD